MAPFEVLAEPNRRRILDLLRISERPVGDLVDQLEVSQPAVSKHLRVLREAGLVEVRSDAQRRMYRVRSEPLRAIDEWLEPYRQLWAARLDDLVNLPASRLAALLIVAAAATTPGASARAAWRAIRRDAGQHRSPNAGYPEAAVAGALGAAALHAVAGWTCICIPLGVLLYVVLVLAMRRSRPPCFNSVKSPA